MINDQIIEQTLKQVSARMMTLKNHTMKEQFPVSLIDIECWEWPQGVGLYGLYKYYTLSQDEAILQFLLDWFDSNISNGIHEKNVNTTAPMLTLTYLYEMTKKPSYLALIEEWTAWIMDDKQLIRTGDDCFQHMITGNPNDGEILIDTIFMTLLFLARAGNILNRPDCLEEVNYQIMNHIKYLYDKQAGLFYHGYNFNHNHNYGAVHWCRGNSWYTVGIMEFLAEHEVDPALRRYYLSVYKAQTAALKAHADPETGLWHTVVDDPSSYIEISGSAAFLCGIMQGVKLGILERKEYQNLIDRALTHLLDYIDPDGTVRNVSYGTPIGDSAEFYKEIPCHPMTYGQALVILNLQEALVGSRRLVG